MHHKTHAPHFSNVVSCGPAAFRCGEKFIDVDYAGDGQVYTSHAPGCLDKSLEKIVGLQTDKPL